MSGWFICWCEWFCKKRLGVFGDFGGLVICCIGCCVSLIGECYGIKLWSISLV